MEIALALAQTLIELFKDTIATFVVIFLIWVVMAAATSEIQDRISSAFKWKSTMLEDTIRTMLGDQDLTAIFYNHPLIKSLYTNNGTRKPVNIPTDKFALVLFDLMLNPGITKIEKINTSEKIDTFEEIKKNIEVLKIPGASDKFHDVAVVLNTLLIGMKGKVEDPTSIIEARRRIENWCEVVYNALGGAYKRRLQVVAIIVGISIAAIFNVDTPVIANSLWNNSVVRQAVATQASQSDKQSNIPPSVEEIAKNVDRLNIPFLPIGWSSKNIPSNPDGWASKIIGILISGIAAAQGAPYWFDLMRKLLSRNPPVAQQPA